MEPAVAELTSKLQCGESEARAALFTAQGDQAEAIRLLRRSIFAIKGKFRSELRKVYGALILFIDAEKDKVLRLHIVLTRESWFYSIDLNQEVMGLEDYVYNTEFRIDTIPTLTKDLNEHIKQKLRDTKLKDVIAAVVNSDISPVQNYFRGLVASQVADREIDITLKAEKINRVRFEKLEKSMRQQEEAAATATVDDDDDQAADDDAGEDEKEKVLILKTDIVLAPLHGKPVHALGLGEKIYVKITDNSPQGRYIANLLKGDAVRPSPVLVPIEEITKTESDRTSLITKFGPGVFGRVVVSDSLKVKTEENEDSIVTKDEPGADYTMVMVVGGAILMVIVLIIILIVSFG